MASQVISELIEKGKRDGPLGFLDVEDDIERLLPGATEEERNNSRLNRLITGEKRPAGHTAKEVGATVAANGLPFLASFLKYVRTSSKGAAGLKTIAKVADDVAKKGGTTDIVDSAMKAAEKISKDAVEEAAKKVAEKESKMKAKTLLGKIMQLQNPRFDKWDLSNAKENLDNVETAIKGISAYPRTPTPRDSINKYAKDKAVKTGAVILSGEKAGESISRAEDIDTGDYEKMKGLENFDNSLEMSKLEKAGQFFLSLVDLDTLNPDRYPMDTINKLLNAVNKETGKWSSSQLNHLGDTEKVRLIKNIVKGKYDTDDKTLSYELYKAYLKLTNNKEENK